MIIAPPTVSRNLKTVSYSADLTVVGGGLSGVCCAITAARQGVKVALVQDRPVLGGNASSEVRLWALGATSHQGNNNRWAREGGVINELVVENTFRNKEGNPIFFDALLLEKVKAEPNITLLLNTAVLSAEKSAEDTIRGVRAFNSQNSTMYHIESPLFCDSSGDGILGYLSGAAYRIGSETADEFGEGFAPDTSYGELLGHTIYFYSKDMGKPVTYTPPEFALKDIEQIPRHDAITVKSHGCSLWWLEYGGRMDTVHDTEEIKWELWKVAYGVWNYLKNSGKFPETATHTLEWIGSIPGKRESRRFEGDYMLSQRDIVQQKRFDDAVSVGGWAVDLHPADGVYSDKPECTQYHSKGVYQIPYRCMYSRNVANLFLAGRLISASHVAFGSTRVMMTCAHGGQAVGMAAAICRESGLRPRDVVERVRMADLQRRLSRTGQYMPHVEQPDPEDLARTASIIGSSQYMLKNLAPSGAVEPCDVSRALLVPAQKGRFPKVTLYISSDAPRELEVQLRVSERLGNFTPDTALATRTVALAPGADVPVSVDFDVELAEAQYAFVCVMRCDGVSLAVSDDLVSGVMSLGQKGNKNVAKGSSQKPPAGSGFDEFEFWVPKRRPGGKLIAAAFDPPINAFSTDELKTAYARPFIRSNTWVADAADPQPSLRLTWNEPQAIGRVVLFFDVDYDHAMESAQFGHFDSAMPFCVKAFAIKTGDGAELYRTANNHQGRVEIALERPVHADSLVVEFSETHGCPVAVSRILVFQR